MRLTTKVSILIILAAAFVSFLLSVSLWFGVFGDPDRELGMFVGLWVPSILALGALLSPRGATVIPLLALTDGTLFAIGSVIFIAVFTAALRLAYARFEELGEDDRRSGEG